ncbi:MAG: sodium:calcium antiporter [Thermoproteota archaeon]|nr:sodium:calcium antiporter [Candidatus Brockarchaeota archaeon]
MELLIWVAELLFGGILIATSGSMLVNIAEKIMKQFKLSELSVGFLLLSVSTSSPELSVAIISALENKVSISVGDILGSNVTNITLIAGVALVIAGEVIMNEQNIIELADVLFLATMIPLSLLVGGWITRLTGIFLLVVYLFYIRIVLSKKKIYYESEENEYTSSLISPFEYIVLLLCIGGLIIGAKMVIDSVSMLSELLNIHRSILAAKVVALSTSLPELVVETTAAKKGRVWMALGDAIGSNLVNTTLILGLLLTLDPSMDLVAFSVLIIPVLVSSLVFLYLLSKRRIDRNGGLILLGIYVLFQALVTV